MKLCSQRFAAEAAKTDLVTLFQSLSESFHQNRKDGGNSTEGLVVNFVLDNLSPKPIIITINI